MFKASWNRFKFGAVVSGLLLAGGLAFAQTGGVGAINTSPVALGATAPVLGFLPFNAGPQASVIQVSGGTFTCTSGGSIVVSNTNATANSVVLMSAKTPGGTGLAQPQIGALTAGTGFTAKCVTNDTSVYNYWVIG